LGIPIIVIANAHRKPAAAKHQSGKFKSIGGAIFIALNYNKTKNFQSSESL
jgi:hypothetical protein